MSVLSASQIAAMEATAGSALPDTCMVLRPTDVPNDMGGQTRTWGTAVASVACRIRPGGLAPDEARRREGVVALGDWVITMPAGTDVQKTDRVVSGSRTFEVTQGSPPSWEIATRVRATEVT